MKFRQYIQNANKLYGVVKPNNDAAAQSLNDTGLKLTEERARNIKHRRLRKLHKKYSENS